MFFSPNVRYLLTKKRWKAIDLSRETKISQPSIFRYLNGERQPKIEQVIEISRALDINIDDLLLKDLTKESGRPFGAEGEDSATTDETLTRMNELLEQRLRIVEQALLKSDPELAASLGITE